MTPTPETEHADRAAAADTRWAALRKEIQAYQNLHYDRASDLTDEGKDGAEVATARAEELGWVLKVMTRIETETAVTERAKQRTAELFAASDNPNWLGI